MESVTGPRLVQADFYRLHFKSVKLLMKVDDA